ncbi:MAG: dihydroorotate dehydrogenase electron transfer subunit, partial [Kiritimatiellia bacterium]|nr:dihydroorotate dehydrogenase electron transfer subunit [Kiritimatiellia bacterium]
MMIQESGRVIENQRVRGAYRVLLLELPKIAGEAQPGQFVHVKVPGLEASRLRRPFSIAGAEHGVLRLLYKDVGAGSHALSLVGAGTVVDVLGPVGRGFPIECEGTPLLVGGG